MQKVSIGRSELWSIILAGGDGKRVSPLVQRWMGCHRPKQYCAFVGKRSMFQHTVDRAAMVGPLDRTVVVVDRTHAVDANEQLHGRSVAQLILQPANRGTAAGILLPLSYVHAANPEATVAVCPSDHYVYPEDRFVEALHRAADTAELFPDRLIMLGVVPDSAETDYGWIRPASPLDRGNGRVRAVDSFMEKPGPVAAQVALSEGALWNTLILVAKVQSLRQLARQYLPDVFGLFEMFEGALSNGLEEYALNSIYSVMPSRDVSSALLQRATRHLAVAVLDGIHWSDWGRPERIVATLREIGKVPAFPPECLTAAMHPVADNRLASTA